MKGSITFDEEVKGWTSFHSFEPDFIQGMNNRFFTFKNGELYEHHDNDEARNTYYGVQSPSKVAIMVNDSPSEIKELQAISLEGNNTWETLIKAFVSNSDEFFESSVTRAEFVRKEGIWFAYARRNESEESFDSKSTYGIGSVESVDGTTVMFNGGSSSLCIGDRIVRGSDLMIIGAITDIIDSSLVLDVTGDLAQGDFILGMKNARIEGGNLRGYTLRMDLENTENTKVELFAVNAEVMKSYS